MRTDIVIGSTLPDYELPDHADVPRKLSLLQGTDPMVLTLNRGFYCPKDRQHLIQLVDFNKQCAVGFTRVVSITTDTLFQSNELRLGVGADWTFLHDEKRVIQRELDIAEYTDVEHDPMIPHTFVLEPGLKISKIYNGYWYWGRPSMAELHADLREVTRRIRPDYDLADPEMRAAWQRGDKSRFFPYGKAMPGVFARMANDVDRFD